MRTRPQTPIWGVMAAVALSFAACGSGDEASTGDTASEVTATVAPTTATTTTTASSTATSAPTTELVDCTDPLTMALPDEWDREFTEIIGLRDLDRDGVHELIARPFGNTQHVLGVAFVVDCQLVIAEPFDQNGVPDIITYGYGGNSSIGIWGDVVCRRTMGGIVEIAEIDTSAAIERSDDQLAVMQAFEEWQGQGKPVDVTIRRWRLVRDEARLEIIGAPTTERTTWDDSPHPHDNAVDC